jgi:2-polyprenyl-6-hydroxyphenyl methylase/3-demethylubiquinone-9 3-methyltransferase
MSYYRQNLSGERLRKVYELAPPRVRQYLEAEIRFLQYRLHPGDEVLELGCGYGRVMLELAPKVRRILGVDISEESLELGRKLAGSKPNVEYHEMDALELTFPNGTFDAVVCIQNGICAFHVNPEKLMLEALRATRRGGCAFFSSYVEAFWPHRLEWFELQARHGLVGEIDYDQTGDGVIVCKDGFRAGAMERQDFRSLCARLRLNAEITEVDASSTFCVIAKE